MNKEYLKLYFCNINNFGDALNKYIFSKCFGVEIEYANPWECDAIGIGSILERELLQVKDLCKYFKEKYNPHKKEVVVLSSGFGREDSQYKEKFRFLYNMKFKRNLKILSLRGKLTKQSIERITNLDLSKVILGDLGLLSSMLLEKRMPQKYNIGICPHYADKGDPIFQKILQENANSIMLDTEDNPILFIEKLSQCKTVISTGLHPLICADSLGIPNLWCRISEKTTTRHKYKDYYSIYDIAPEPINLLNENIDMNFIIDNYKVQNKKVEEIKQRLLEIPIQDIL